MKSASISPPGMKARVEVPRELALGLASACTPAMDGHQWAGENVTMARAVLDGPAGWDAAGVLASLLGRPGVGPGWAVLRMPSGLDDARLRLAGAGMLAAIGRPFFSINEGGSLWIGGESTPERDAASFGGNGRQGLHIDAPNTEIVPDYTSLLVLRPDPAGGGHSLVGDLHAALAEMSGADRGELAQLAYFEGHAHRLCGTGAPRMPFPVLDDGGPGRPWIRWAAKMTADRRNHAHMDVLHRYAEALDAHSWVVPLERGCLLVLDQQRAAHGRAALGDQAGLPNGTRRLLLQAKSAFDPAAPAQVLASASGTSDE
ncbi:MAG TPA: TauD/TfdA family dioxygenase [Trebonia sp.]|nr:TauD/TfdA family dioxygenase [Trebonia sp.]